MPLGVSPKPTAAGDGASTHPRMITRRVIVGLAVWVALHAALVSLAVLGPIQVSNLGEVLNPNTLPAALAGLSVALAFLLSPLWLESRVLEKLEQAAMQKEVLVRAAFMGAWQGAALGYFLLVASRVADIDGANMLRAILVVALASALAVLLAAWQPRAYAGIALLWTVCLPFSCYVLVEVFLAFPAGSPGWASGSGPAGEPIRAFVDWALTLSPGSSAIAALNGSLPSDTPYGWKTLAAFVTFGVIVSVLLVLRLRPRTPS